MHVRCMHACACSVYLICVRIIKALRRNLSVDFDISSEPGRAPAAHLEGCLENIHRAALNQADIPSPQEQLALIRAEKQTKRQGNL